MNEITKKKRGRPAGYRAQNPLSEPLAVNVTKDQLTAYKAASERTGQTFSAWVRSALDKAAKKA